MQWEEFRKAFNGAKSTIQTADSHVADMAGMIRGRLRSSGVPGYILRDLKKELENYNMHTKEWKA